jgi:hypothetical protein
VITNTAEMILTLVRREPRPVELQKNHLVGGSWNVRPDPKEGRHQFGMKPTSHLF